MLSRYGFRFEEKDKWGATISYNPSAEEKNILMLPLYFTTVGLYELWASSLPWNAGFVGRVWSSTSGANLSLVTGQIAPSAEWFEYQGLSLRVSYSCKTCIILVRLCFLYHS